MYFASHITMLQFESLFEKAILKSSMVVPLRYLKVLFVSKNVVWYQIIWYVLNFFIFQLLLPQTAVYEIDVAVQTSA